MDRPVAWTCHANTACIQIISVTPSAYWSFKFSPLLHPPSHVLLVHIQLLICEAPPIIFFYITAHCVRTPSASVYFIYLCSNGDEFVQSELEG